MTVTKMEILKTSMTIIHQRQRVITNMAVIELSKKNNGHFERHFLRCRLQGMAGVKDRCARKNSTNLTMIERFRPEKKMNGPVGSESHLATSFLVGLILKLRNSENFISKLIRLRKCFDL